MVDLRTVEYGGRGRQSFIVVRQFFHAENGDYILQVFVTLQQTLDFASYVVMLVADNFRIKNRRAAIERINGRINADFGQGPR